MKTFDEALDMMMLETPLHENGKRLPADQVNRKVEHFYATTRDEINRRSDVAADIAKNPRTLTYLRAMMEAEREDEGAKNVLSLALNCFINGVLIGIDMERRDEGVKE